MNFDDIIGQENIKAQLRRQLASGNVAHAQLFAGPEGCGKLPMAIAFATALLCQQPTGTDPCGTCLNCRMAHDFTHPDLHFVFPCFKQKGQSGELVCDQYLKEWRAQLHDTPYFDRLQWLKRIGVENQQSIIGVAESENIVRKLSLVSSQGGRKVVIIWLPEQMNTEAANKLLKILEEPPLGTVFLLVSDQPERLLPTILSRTQRTDFLPLAYEEIVAELENRRGLQHDDAAYVAHAAQGNFIKALQQICVDEDAEMFFDLFVLLMRLAWGRKTKDIYQWTEQVAGWGRERQKKFLEYSQRLVRENFIYNFHRPELNYMTRKEAEFSVRFARFINEANVIPIMEELSAAQRDIEQNVNPRMVFFDFALKLIVLLIAK